MRAVFSWALVSNAAARQGLVWGAAWGICLVDVHRKPGVVRKN
jgi:hypothetical protein